MIKKQISLLVLALFATLPLYSQKKTPQKRKITVKKGQQVVLTDTIFIPKSDTVIYLNAKDAEKIKIKENPYKKSDKFYDSLKKKAEQSKLTKGIFDFVVKENGKKEKTVGKVLKNEEAFKAYEGYTIGTISYKNVDLLEGSVVDTVRVATTKIGEFVNDVHVDTRAVVIKQNLLFKEGDKVDPYKLADNERLLRQFKTLRDARIYLQPRAGEPKIVDVVVVTQDVLSLGVSAGYSSLKNFRFDLYDINMLGYAKQLQVSYYRNALESPHNGYEVTLREQNLHRTFVQAELQYTHNYLRERTRLSLGRDFFTPQIKYAGGLDMYRTHERFYFEEYDTLQTPYAENNVDVWAGRSFEVRRRVNFIISTRLNTQRFIERPFVSSDSNTFFVDRTLLLSSLTLTKRNYLKTRRITGYGKTEDVPVGATVSVLAGKEFNEFIDRSYVEVNGIYRRYLEDFGYLSLSLATGSYFRANNAEDGLLKLSGLYFSNLKKVRRLQIRQFINYTYTRGFNRILDKSVTLDGKWKSDINLLPNGSERMTLGLETDYFMPWYVYGFQFVLYHGFDFNLLADEQSLFSRSSIFPMARIGMRTLNDNLILPTLTVEIDYFGKNKNYNASWGVRVSTTLPNLFGATQAFKPKVTPFN